MTVQSQQQHSFGLLTPGLMPPDDVVQLEQLRSSVPGMAHWGSTGPADRTCRECAHWGASKSFRRDEGHLCARRCQQFSRLMQGAQGAGVPHAQPSCRHFALRDRPPTVEPRQRKKESAEASE